MYRKALVAFLAGITAALAGCSPAPARLVTHVPMLRAASGQTTLQRAAQDIKSRLAIEFAGAAFSELRVEPTETADVLFFQVRRTTREQAGTIDADVKGYFHAANGRLEVKRVDWLHSTLRR